MEKNVAKEALDRLKSLLNVAHYKDIAEDLGVNPRTLQTWKQRAEIPPKEVIKICNKYGVTKGWLLHGETNTVEEPVVAYGAVSVPILNPKASAGGGNNVESIDVYESGKRLTVDPALFPVPPGKGIRAIQVDGYSMVPVLLPESWVFFDESREWSGDGLYVLVFRGVLMVKQVVADVKTGNLWIRSANPDYESWEYDPTEDQSTMRIVGRVVRVMM